MQGARQTSQRIVIVGGGVSGLSIACRLVQSGLPVTVLESARLGFAASTRNQGWLHSGAWFAPQHVDLARNCYESLQQTIEFCPDCLEPGLAGMAFIIPKPETDRIRWTNAWKQAGIPHEEWPLSDLFEQISEIDRAFVQQAFRLPDCAMRPDLLVTRLGAVAENAGAEIRAETPVSRLIVQDGSVGGVVTGAGEEIAARLVILAGNASGAALWPTETRSTAGGQSEFTRVALKSHLLALSPEVCRVPFCVVDGAGFNHVPHALTSVFGSDRWQVVSNASDQTIVADEIKFLWNTACELFPQLEPSDYEVTEWAGTTVQAMHIDQIEPGHAPLPTVIDHQQESPPTRNLLSVFPGRATLWPQLAEQARRTVMEKLGSHLQPTATPPWAQK